MALLKVDSENMTKYEMKEYTKSSEDIQMRMKYKDFEKGEYKVKLQIENTMKIAFIINSVLPVPELNCAGAQEMLTAPKF